MEAAKKPSAGTEEGAAKKRSHGSTTLFVVVDYAFLRDPGAAGRCEKMGPAAGRCGPSRRWSPSGLRGPVAQAGVLERQRCQQLLVLKMPTGDGCGIVRRLRAHAEMPWFQKAVGGGDAVFDSKSDSGGGFPRYAH